ncbi:hypothetical protein B0J11DRAFT_512506, partial [Dendryphion nanum]
GLLLLFENGTKASHPDDETSHCRIQSAAALASFIEDILNPFKGLEEDKVVVDVQTISPFILHLIYKAAAIVTERLHLSIDLELNLKKARTFRKILKLMGQRWLAGGVSK